MVQYRAGKITCQHGGLVFSSVVRLKPTMK